MKLVFGLALTSLAVLSAMFLTLFSLPTDIPQDTEIVPIISLIGQETKVVPMHIPPHNELPWAFVWGNVDNAVEGHSVMISIYQEGELVHSAKTDIREDGSFEYRFRVRDVDGDQVINIFQGNYVVKILKTVYLNHKITFA